MHNIAAEGPPRRLQASLRLISIVLPEEQQAVRCFIAAKFTVAQRRLP
jgi:hypothetical protein